MTDVCASAVRARGGNGPVLPIHNISKVPRYRSIMNKIRARKFSQFAYGDPRSFLVGLRKVEATLTEYSMPDKLRRMRTNGLKPEREMRDAALFCVGISERLGLQIKMAPVEDEDFDFVATWVVDETQHFCTVQLKEVAPEDLNPSSSIENVFQALNKYPSAHELTVAIRLNRTTRFDPSSIRIPKDLALGGLWLFGCISEDQSKWAIWGDFVFAGDEPVAGTIFDYPS